MILQCFKSDFVLAKSSFVSLVCVPDGESQGWGIVSFCMPEGEGGGGVGWN